jgi:hypothetical protein
MKKRSKWLFAAITSLFFHGLIISQPLFFWEEGLPGGEPDNPCMKKSIVGGSEVFVF